ncbi:ECF transporter S component [Microbacterium oxydans]|uniref:ECF transporter S component n=1 Tax=Microbacterium oxydans TaxID=82380 RepID=UPI0036707AA9
MSGTDAAGGLASRDSAGDAPAEAATGHRASDAGGRFRFPTAILLTCAALGVAGAVLLAPMNWFSTLLTGPLPFVGMALAGLWLLPSVIALRLLRKPLVGLFVALIAGLVMVPFSGYGFSSVLTNLWWAAFTELPFLFVLWRYWGTWMHYVGAAVVGVVYPISAWAWFDLGSMSLFAQVAFFAVTIASCVGGTALGILIADRLRRAGVGRAGAGRAGAGRAGAGRAGAGRARANRRR